MPRISPGEILSSTIFDDLVERKAELFERQDAVELRKLIGTIVPVAGLRIDAHGPQHAEAFVVAQQAARHARDLGKLADPEHWTYPVCQQRHRPVLRGVKVKRDFRARFALACALR